MLYIIIKTMVVFSMWLIILFRFNQNTIYPVWVLKRRELEDHEVLAHSVEGSCLSWPPWCS